jgi:Lrp/AsnC family transcriptional regulator, leucine-responsive regulatory protein
MDAVDREILRILVANGRASHVLIGREVGLSPNAVADRVRRLVADGVITGVHAAVDPSALGRSMTALIDVRLLPNTTPDDLEQAASKLDGVQEIAFLTGRFDFQLRVACRDSTDLDRLLRELRATAGVGETETRLVLRDLLRRNLSG